MRSNDKDVAVSYRVVVKRSQSSIAVCRSSPDASSRISSMSTPPGLCLDMNPSYVRFEEASLLLRKLQIDISSGSLNSDEFT